MPQPASRSSRLPGLDEQEHREDEERLVGVVAALLVVTLHVAGRRTTTIRKPTPETTSIMKTDSGSTTISMPTRRSPAESQVQSVETWTRSSGSSVRSAAKA